MQRARGQAMIARVGDTSHARQRPQERFLYERDSHRDSQFTRTNLWAWGDAVRRLEAPPAGAVEPRELLDAMRDPRFYGADPNEPVELRETHVSWVFLVGDRAYKLKKPLVLPFLDYGDVAARRRMCQREIALNRPLGGDIYLGVRAVVRRGGRLRLGADGGGAVDHLVEMRRFDEASTLAAALASGRASARDITAVAGRLARFHAASPPRRQDCNVVARIARTVDGNTESLLRHDELFDPARVLATQRFADAFLSGHAALISWRTRTGRVRECHGDLRAEHVLLGEEVRAIDCVEFDDAFREIDVAEDLAFLVMDLTRCGHGELARTLVTRYRDAGGDAGPDELIAFHASIKALVRAKVAALVAVDPSAPAALRVTAGEQAGEHLALAERLAWQARLPLALVVCGPPAAGKSQLAQALAEQSGLEVVSADETRKQLAGIGPSSPALGEAYTTEMSARAYAELGRRAAAQLASASGVIVDATFGQRKLREAFASAFGEVHPTIFCECRAPIDVLRRRARARLADPQRVSDAGPALAARLAERFEPLETDIAPQNHLIVRSDRPVARLVADIVAMLDSRLALPEPAGDRS
jgi:aminoglycoside phosphotransferase family enzyme/predicted kinase